MVALHRAARIAKQSTNTRVLLTTFSRPLASMLAHKLKLLTGETTSVSPRIAKALGDGFHPFEIAVFVRDHEHLDRARAAVAAAGGNAFILSGRNEEIGARIAIGTMHLAKGLEFKAVAVMACDDDLLPLQSRIEAVADEVDLDDVYETERQLLYVACTRARDRLFVSGVAPASEFLNDMDGGKQ